MNQTQKPFTRLNHEQWQQIINQQLKSDLNQKNFCQTHNISLATFSNWKRKLKEESAPHSQIVQLQPDSQSDKEWIDSLLNSLLNSLLTRHQQPNTHPGIWSLNCPVASFSE